MESFEVYLPHLPLFEQEMISVLLACEESSRMLIALLISTVAIRVRELGVRSLLDIPVVTDRQVGSCSEGRSEIYRVEDGTLLVDEAHLLFERQRKEKGLSPHI
jgi:hypothetical protein